MVLQCFRIASVLARDTARASVGLQARFTFLLGSKTKGSDERFGMSGFPTSLLLQNVPLFNPYTWVQMTSLSHSPHLAIYCTYCRCRGCKACCTSWASISATLPQFPGCHRVSSSPHHPSLWDLELAKSVRKTDASVRGGHGVADLW